MKNLKEVKKIKGYVIGKTQGFYEIKSKDKIYNLKLKGNLKKTNNKLNCVIGDYVEFDETINFISKRKNILIRPLVANVDDVAMVYSCMDPKFDINLLQKNLLWIDMQHVNRILILNKVELLTKDELEKFIDNLKKIFNDLLIFPISLKENIGLTELKKFLENKHIVLSGNTGVGKSSLVNFLVNEPLVKVGEISRKTKKGKNTTIITKYFENGDIKIFDTPGYSSIEFPKFKEKKEVMEWFLEFSPYLGECKFRDCIHINEPNCSVKNAVENGKINIIRYEFYKSILEKKEGD